MSADISSEQKLLNLIRNGSGGGRKGRKKPANGAVSFEWGGAASLFWDIGAVLFLLASIGLLFVLGMKWFVHKPLPEPIPGMLSNSGELRGQKIELAGEKSRYDSEYRDIIEARDIFGMVLEQKKEVALPQMQAKSPLSERYKLLGIMLDSNPSAIIEDLQTHQTAILSKGQKINDVSLEEVKPDRVIMKEDERLIELIR